MESEREKREALAVAFTTFRNWLRLFVPNPSREFSLVEEKLQEAHTYADAAIVSELSGVFRDQQAKTPDAGQSASV
jgi:hypothetical protein